MLAKFHNSSMATVQVVYSLCDMPDYIPALRLEAQTVLKSGGGVWNIENLSRLYRLDSFLKESQRVNASSFRMFIYLLLFKIVADLGLICF